MRDEDKTKNQLVSELKQCREEYKTLAYIVSHDLRTPLINLKGFSAELRFALETIQSAVKPLLPQLEEKARAEVTAAIESDVPEALGFIEFSVNRIDGFISAVLKLSRLGRRELRFEPIDVDVVVQKVLGTLAEQIEQRQAKVTVRSPLPAVVADRASFEEIMGHILKNAVVYLDPDRPGEIEVTGESDADETTFHIRDNGRGIAEGNMHKVFQPFRRAGREDVPGEGMGLVYAQILVRLHGGHISCVSEPGVGSEFAFAISNRLVGGDDYVQ